MVKFVVQIPYEEKPEAQATNKATENAVKEILGDLIIDKTSSSEFVYEGHFVYMLLADKIISVLAAEKDEKTLKMSPSNQTADVLKKALDADYTIPSSAHTRRELLLTLSSDDLVCYRDAIDDLAIGFRQEMQEHKQEIIKLIGRRSGNDENLPLAPHEVKQLSSQTSPSAPEAEAVSKTKAPWLSEPLEYPAGFVVLPETKFWFKSQSIESLNIGQKIQAEAEYKRWAKHNQEKAQKFSFEKWAEWRIKMNKRPVNPAPTLSAH